MDKISAVIVTWNAEGFIRKCLDSVFAQGAEVREVFVVDNHSTDKTLKIVKESGLRINLIENNENKGFCFANNQALAKADGDFILTLNSDIVLENNYVSELLGFLKNNPEVGMVQGKLLRMDKKTIDALGLRMGPGFRFFNIAEGKQWHSKYNHGFEIFGPCAAAALYKKEMFDDIRFNDEFFDNQFFFLIEDFDVAWRAKKIGWKAMYVPGASCYHFRGSAAHSLPFKQYLSFRNRYFLIIKNATGKDLLVCIFYFFIYDLPRFIFLLFSNPFTLKAIFEVVYSFPKLLRKRNQYAKKIIRRN